MNPSAKVRLWSPLRGPFLCDEIQAGAVLFLHLLCRNNSATKISELHKLGLYCLQPFIPLSVSGLDICSIDAATPKLPIQLLNVSDLRSETPNLFPKNL